MNVIDLLRQATARRTALYAYAQLHDRFAELEQVYVAAGEYDRADDAHQVAVLVLRAYTAEMDDPATPTIDPSDNGRNER